jgi:hypothetical protein
MFCLGAVGNHALSASASIMAAILQSTKIGRQQTGPGISRTHSETSGTRIGHCARVQVQESAFSCISPRSQAI